MPTKKKKFIDKKNAVKFTVGHRSLKDPLAVDENAPKHVLLESIPKEKEFERRRQEQRKYGIYFDDDYDYLKHLKDVNSVVEVDTLVERVRCDKACDSSKDGTLQLPSSVFESFVEEKEDLFNKIPVKGPRPDWDPDIVAALDDSDGGDPDDPLEDDFVLKAMGAESDEITAGREGDDELGDVSSDEAEWYDGHFDTSDREEKFDTKSTYSYCSLTSANLPRSEQLEFLDDKFEKMLEQYDDDQIGGLEGEEITGYINPNSELFSQTVEDFEKQKNISTLQELREQMIDSDGETNRMDAILSESEEFSTVEEEQRKVDKWDCESILSTYSNRSNHPKLITEPKKVPIQINEKTGVPTGVLATRSLTKQKLRKLQRITASDEDSTDEETGREKSVPFTNRSTASTIRLKNETPEERKARKTAVKLMRKERRIEKKCNKIAFKEEKKHQERIQQNIVHNLKAIKLM